MADLYAPFVNEQRPIYFMDTASAELTKYAANAFLVTKISFINEIANVAERLGADVEAIRQAIGADSRIGTRFLQAGIGYGGSCFPKDIQALQTTAKTHGYHMKLLKAAMDVNAHQQRSLTEKLLAYFNNDIKDKKIALWGLAFKPDTDDIREAPSLVIIAALLKAGAIVTAYDPEATEHVRRLYPNEPRLMLADDPYAAVAGADALMIATEWQIFKEVDLQRVAASLKNPVVFDGRNLYEPSQAVAARLVYYSVGRQPVTAAE
jgi:UDPglucose 6-dehydrogenase